jgi:hypothetical protein
MDISKATEPRVNGRLYLVTNNHVLPSEGQECRISMRIALASGQGSALSTVAIPIVGINGKYLSTIGRSKEADVAALNVTPDIAMAHMDLSKKFIFTTQLGTKERLKDDAGLVGDDVYILGYPAGIFDEENVEPIWRIGTIATDPRRGFSFNELLRKQWKLPEHLNGFLIDSQIYPGSSGSAVVLKPSATSFGAGGVAVGGNRYVPYVLGIVSGSIPIVDFDGRVLSRVGLGIVQSADAINDAIEQSASAEQGSSKP